MLITRITKVVMCFVLAAFCLLVTFDNITDYNANYAFVQHVMSMDTTFPGNELRSRAITNPTLWRVVYALIIIAEGLAGALFLVGAVQMARALYAPGAVFNRAKEAAVAGGLVAFLVWFFGFMVVAGEWFDMWQSSTWNGQEAAFRFYMAVLAVLILLVIDDPDLPSRETTPNERR
jgi:predicted small integral membrane protein